MAGFEGAHNVMGSHKRGSLWAGFGVPCGPDAMGGRYVGCPEVGRGLGFPEVGYGADLWGSC